MKKMFTLMSIAIMLLLGTCLVNLTVNPQILVNQDKSMFADTGETYPFLLLKGTQNDWTGGRDSNNGDCYTKEPVINLNKTSSDDGDLNKPSSANTVNNLSNEDFQPPDVPIPDGRIFLGGEPPYGYLPTVKPKENITIPLVPIDFEE